MRRILLSLIVASVFLPAYSQYYDLGQDPASTHWRQIKSRNFNLIYPKEYEGKAQEFANNLAAAKEQVESGLDWKTHRINFIFHTQTVVPNAFALWTPQRTELYTCPSQNSYGQDWLQQLTLHEYRHMVQLDRLNQGFTKALHLLVGQHSTTFIMSLFLPMWFMEGDAVCSETVLSSSGRGRIPSFEMKNRTQVLEKGMFSWSKAEFGSYRDYVPDVYNFGYSLVASLRKTYGEKVFNPALNLAARRPFLLSPFGIGLHQATGNGRDKLYKTAWDSLRLHWAEQAGRETFTEFTPVSAPNPTQYTHYKLPHYLNDSTIIAEKTGRGIIPEIIEITREGIEKKIVTPGYYTSELVFSNVNVAKGNPGVNNSPGSFSADHISLYGSRVAWAGLSIDPRWKQRSYSVIKILDRKTGKIHQITKRTRFFSPSYSPDGTALVVSEVDESTTHFITIIDAQDGRILSRVASPGNEFVTHPSFGNTSGEVLCVTIGKNGKRLIAVNAVSGSVTELIPASFHEISRPLSYKNLIFFNGDYSGIDNIYVLDRNTGEIFRVTSSRYGAVDPSVSPDGARITYSDYTADGFAVVEALLDSKQWIPLTQVKDHSQKVFIDLVKQESGPVNFSKKKDSIYSSKCYSKAGHLVNLHSWVPMGIDLQAKTYRPGITLMSQNLLSTAFINAGYDFERNVENGRAFVNYTYKGWYPLIEISVEQGNRNRYSGDSILLFRREARLSTGMVLPLTFLRNEYSLNLSPGINYRILSARERASEEMPFVEKVRQSVEIRFSMQRLIKKAELDLRPKWGQTFSLVMDRQLHSKSGPSPYTLLEGSLMFPGIARQHSLLLYGGYQTRTAGNYDFQELIRYPRGYYRNYNDQMISFSVDYLWPLAYPDWELGPVLYLKRINANLFYDVGRGSDALRIKNFQAVGISLTGEFHLLRYFVPIEIGLQTAWLPLERRVDCKLLFAFILDKI